MGVQNYCRPLCYIKPWYKYLRYFIQLEFGTNVSLGRAWLGWWPNKQQHRWSEDISRGSFVGGDGWHRWWLQDIDKLK